MSRRPDLRLVPLAILAVLLGLGALLLYRAPVHRYVVACERMPTEDVSCVLEQTRSPGTQHWQVPLGPDARAIVRVRAQRRGPARVLLYLEAPGHAPVFAAEFAGADAATDAETAAAQLNPVLRRQEASGASASTPRPGVRAARVEAVAPPSLRWMAWGGLGVMGLLIVATCRHVVRSPDARAA